MKKILSILLSIVMVLSLTACKNEEPTPTINYVGEIAEFEVDAYLIEEYKEIDEISNESVYHKTLLIYTDGYYSEIESSDIKYESNDGQIDFVDAIDNSTVNVININYNNKVGTCAYVYITTKSLIDMKKVCILVEGPTVYDSEISTKEEYQNKYGNVDGWNAMMIPVGNKTPPMSNIEVTYNGDNYGLIRMFGDGRNVYWYEVKEQLKATTSSIAVELSVLPLKNTTKDDFVKEFISGCYPANLNGEKYKEVKLDSNIKINGWVENDVVYIGYSTIDGSDISSYVGSLPPIVYNNNYLIHVFNFN